MNRAAPDGTMSLLPGPMLFDEGGRTRDGSAGLVLVSPGMKAWVELRKSCGWTGAEKVLRCRMRRGGCAVLRGAADSRL